MSASAETLTAIESLKVKSGAYQAHYLKAGSGPAIVLIHGGASDSRDWLPTMAALSNHYGLYALDLIGYGESDNPKSGYYLSDFAKFTLEFIQALHLDAPVLVGHSLDGRVALEIGLRYPETVGKLVLIDNLGFGRMGRYGSILTTLAWAVRKLLRQPQPYPTFLKDEGERTNWVCVDELPGLKVPTLIVWKRWEPYFPLPMAAEAERLIPGARLVVVPGYGHAPHKQKNNPFSNLLLGFLNHR